jgi:hypothetical protein
MKTLGRILIIILAFAVMTGITYSAVNASGSSTNTPVFQRGGDGFAPDGARPEFRGDDGGNSFGILFGVLKNTIIVAVIVALIVFPKNLLQQKRRAVPVRIE